MSYALLMQNHGHEAHTKNGVQAAQLRTLPHSEHRNFGYAVPLWPWMKVKVVGGYFKLDKMIEVNGPFKNGRYDRIWSKTY